MGSQRLTSESEGVLLNYSELKDEDSLVDVRGLVRMHAKDLGFSTLNQTKIMTAASELSRNVVEHGLGGSVRMERLQVDDRIGLRLTFEDSGPGIADLSLALQDGFTSKNGLGLGLSGSKRLMDEFDLQSEVGVGTKVVVTKWT